MYVVIMAGGGGTRLWPLSRPDRPKPFLPLTGDIPEGVTLREYRSERPRPQPLPQRRGWRGRARLRLTLR